MRVTLKAFIPVSRIFDSEDDILLFPGLFENPAPAVKKKVESGILI